MAPSKRNKSGGDGATPAKKTRKADRRGTGSVHTVMSQLMVALVIVLHQVAEEVDPVVRKHKANIVSGYVAARHVSQNGKDGAKNVAWSEGLRALEAVLTEADLADAEDALEGGDDETDQLCCRGCGAKFRSREALIGHYMEVHHDECAGLETMQALARGEVEVEVDVDGDVGSASTLVFPSVVAHEHATVEASGAVKEHMQEGSARKPGRVDCASCSCAARLDAVRLTSYFWGVKVALYGAAWTAKAGGADGAGFHEFLSLRAMELLLGRLGRLPHEIRAILNGLAASPGTHLTLPGTLFVGTSKTVVPPERWEGVCDPTWLSLATGKSIAIGTLGSITLRVARGDAGTVGGPVSLEHALVGSSRAPLFVLEGTLKTSGAGDGAPRFHKAVLSSVVSVEEPHKASCQCGLSTV